MNCPHCGATLQATAKVFLSFDEDGTPDFGFAPPVDEDGIRFYCMNDHDVDVPEDFAWRALLFVNDPLEDRGPERTQRRALLVDALDWVATFVQMDDASDGVSARGIAAARDLARRGADADVGVSYVVEDDGSIAFVRCTSDDPTNHQGDTCPVHES